MSGLPEAKCSNKDVTYPLPIPRTVWMQFQEQLFSQQWIQQEPTTKFQVQRRIFQRQPSLPSMGYMSLK